MVLIHMLCSFLSYAAFLIAFIAGMLFLAQEHQLKHKQMGWLFHRLPSLDVLDRINFVAIGAGFALLTVGLGYGVLETKLLLGRWWTGDSKVYLTVVLWSSYLALWLLRLRATLRGHRVALLSALGFCLVVLTVIGASYLVPSLHPYL